MRLSGTERVRDNAYRPDLLRVRMAGAVDPSVADPHDRSGPSVDQPHAVAEFQSFDHDLAALGRDAGPGDEAGELPAIVTSVPRLASDAS